MSYTFKPIAVIALLATLAGCTATLNVADQNFESARRNRLRGNEQVAQKDYLKAATAYEQSFAANRKDGKTPFLSSRLKAGMSLYWAGQPQEALDLFTSLYDAKDRTLETLVYGGLCAARLGDRDKAVMFWSKLDAGHDVYILHQAVAKALAGLEDGSMNLDQAHDAVQTGLISQDRRNILQRVTPKSALSGDDTCSGRFWWRYNESTCSTDIRPGSASW